MVRQALKDAARIERRQYVPDKHRTPDRNEVADWIEDHAANDWQEWTHQEIADETGYSRQHVDNVVEQYFNPVGEQEGVGALGEELGLGDISGLQRALGQEVSRELLIYRLGYRDGQRDAREEFDETGEEI